MKKSSLAVFAVFVCSVFLSACAPVPEAGASSEQQWENCKNIYATVLQNSGEDESTAAYLAIAQRSQKLLAQLEENTGAFVINAENYIELTEGDLFYTLNNHSVPVEVDPNGCCIQVSPNYFAQNPIETADGTPLPDCLVYDDCTLNVLVPEQYHNREADILAAHRADFYYEKVTADNDYNEMAGLPPTQTLTEEDLSVNIIYVKNHQRYFTYRRDCAPETGNWITDPVAQVYTGNIHCNYAHSFLSQWTYYPSDAGSAGAAYQELLPYITACGAENSLTSLRPLLDG